MRFLFQFFPYTCRCWSGPLHGVAMRYSGVTPMRISNSDIWTQGLTAFIMQGQRGRSLIPHGTQQGVDTLGGPKIKHPSWTPKNCIRKNALPRNLHNPSFWTKRPSQPPPDSSGDVSVPMYDPLNPIAQIDARSSRGGRRPRCQSIVENHKQAVGPSLPSGRSRE